MTDELDFDTLRRHTAKVPIFCQQCRRQGRAVYLKGDDPRIIKENGSGYYRGPTMRLTAYLAGAPRVCQKCDKQLLDAIDTFSEQEQTNGEAAIQAHSQTGRGKA